jgi:hypothetical protein
MAALRFCHIEKYAGFPLKILSDKIGRMTRKLGNGKKGAP